MTDTEFIDKAIIACMQGLQANTSDNVLSWSYDKVADYSAKMAKELLKERNKLIDEIRGN